MGVKQGLEQCDSKAVTKKSSPKCAPKPNSEVKRECTARSPSGESY